MTKLARVISIFFIILLSLIFTPIVSAGFGDLIKPPEEENIQQGTFNNETIKQSSNISPDVTFGDLLDKFSSVSSQEKVSADDILMAEKTERFKKLLSELEENYKVSLAQFRAKTANSTNNYQSFDSAWGRQSTINNISSTTPIIPIPTLIAGVTTFTTHNSSILPGANPQPTTFYPTPTLTDQLLLASINNSTAPSPTPYQSTIEQSNNRTINVLGTLTKNPVKTTYTVVLLGDSMTDTLGADLPHLRGLLTDAYPDYSFALLNYGQGSTDMESGLYRLTNSTKYLDRDYPPLLSYKPDILVVESFAYNHWSGEKYDLDRQWLTIAKIIDTVREKSPDTKIVLSATITPNKDIFGDGVLNWPKPLKEQSTLIIKAYLQNMVNFATSQGIPLADAYHPTLQRDGEGTSGYISSFDHLHPSSDGAYLYSRKIVEAIKSNNLIN